MLPLYLLIARKRPGCSIRATVQGWPRANGWRFFLILRGWSVEIHKV